LHSQSTIGSKIVIFGGHDGSQERNDVWAFDTTDSSWSKLRADDKGDIESIDYPETRSSHSQSSVGSKIIIFGGDLTTFGQRGNDVWSFDTTTPNLGDVSTSILSFDVSAIGTGISANLYLELNAFATGDNGGVAANGVELYVWDDQGDEFKLLQSNTAATRAAGFMSQTVPSSYKTTDNKINFLIKGIHSRSATIGSDLDLDPLTLRLAVPYVP